MSNIFTQQKSPLESSRTDGIISTKPNITTTDPMNRALGVYDKKSLFLRRKLVVILSNDMGYSVSITDFKLQVAGSKFIGVQQDNFTVIMHNIDYFKIATYISKGYRKIQILIDYLNDYRETVFSGEIRLINLGRESAVERQVEFVCLRRVTDFLANMLVPFTMSSSMNYWSIWEALEQLRGTVYSTYGENINFSSQYEGLLKKTYVRNEEYNAKKSPIAIVEDLINMANKNNISDDVHWLEFKFAENDNTINIFGDNSIEAVLEIGPNTGMLSIPRISDTGITFDHVYYHKLIPGRVVKLDNALVSTMGGNSPIVWALDNNGTYVITEVRYSLETFPNNNTCSIKAKPYSKYGNFTKTDTIY